MSEYFKINLEDLSEMMDGDKLQSLISDFSCPMNDDIERFFHDKALAFAQQRLASVYLVFAADGDVSVFAGYYALTYKHFYLDMDKAAGVSSALRRRILRYAVYNEELGEYIVSAPLIGQLGKNYARSANRFISGDALLRMACDTVAEAQRLIGGRIVYLECEEKQNLLRFYENNGFRPFGRRKTDEGKEQELVQLLKYLK